MEESPEKKARLEQKETTKMITEQEDADLIELVKKSMRHLKVKELPFMTDKNVSAIALNFKNGLIENQSLPDFVDSFGIVVTSIFIDSLVGVLNEEEVRALGNYEKKKVGAFRSAKNIAKEMDVVLRLLRKKDDDSDAEVQQKSTDVVTAKHAFEQVYKANNELESSFMDHLEKQFGDFQESDHHPFFPIIQSSGYGKSRLMDQFVKEGSGDWTFCYLSFAHTDAFPMANVSIETGAKVWEREIVEKAFVKLFDEALVYPKDKFTMKLEEENKNDTDVKLESEAHKKVVFVVDEVSQLSSLLAANKVSFFRCLRKAMMSFKRKRDKSFFVVLSTFAFVNEIIPGLRIDPSYKNVPEEQSLQPMPPFLCHHALLLENNEQNIMNKQSKDCLKPSTLLAMGRPIWEAYLKSNVSADKLIRFAIVKLLGMEGQISKLDSLQKMALVSCRACLTISPTSVVASDLVASHMATAVSISSDRNEMNISYPSEPALALASRSVMRSNTNFRDDVFTELKAFFTSGAVRKGHQGEVIVRLLNLHAIDKCMDRAMSHEVEEIPLAKYLEQFNREGHSLSDLLNGQPQKEIDPKVADKLKTMGLFNEDGLKATVGPRSWSNILKKGYVCFTHFVYLEKGTNITPNLLGYAYRRTAAIVVDDGRRGIDWIIPVKIPEEENKPEKFAGLVGQDKNRVNDTLESLSSSDETGSKVNSTYFLTEEERTLFESEEFDMNWPAILFAIGSDLSGVAFVEHTRRRLRSSPRSPVDTPFGCMVLLGLDYYNLMSKKSVKLLRELRDMTIEAPHEYMESVPLTYGSKLNS